MPKRVRVQDFRQDVPLVRGAMRWLLNRGVSRHLIAEIFGKTPGAISVAVNYENAHRRQLVRLVNAPPVPDLRLAEDDFLPDMADSKTRARANQADRAGANFWGHVRGLEGIRQYRRILQAMSKPSRENLLAQRLQSQIRQMVGETYLHAGYTKAATHEIRKVVSEYFDLFRETRSRADLASFAKALVLFSRARIQDEWFDAALKSLTLAEEAFAAAHMPIDPEVYRQRAEVALAQNLDEAAQSLYRKAFSVFPAHREVLGFGATAHARYDAGKRPLALISADFQAALAALEVSKAWPDGDIHHAINLNAAIATALLSNSSEARSFPKEEIQKAVEASRGYGQQMTRAVLLDVTPRIPAEHKIAWVRFVLRYNAYRNR